MLLLQDGAFTGEAQRRGIPLRVLRLPSKMLAVKREEPLRLLSALAQSVAALRVLRRELAALDPDVIHTNSVKAHLMVVPVAWSLGIPVVMHVRDALPGIGRRLLSLVGRLAVARVAISTAIARWYAMPMETLANPIVLPAHGVCRSQRDARAALGIPDDRPVVGIVGRINRWKGHDRFLRIVARIHREVPIRALIVGDALFRDGDFVPELQRLAEELKLQDVVRFVGWREDLTDVYAALDVHCNCSEREPFGRSIAEAAAAGRPNVAFDDGGAADIIEHGVNGRLVPAGCEERFAEALLEYLRDPERCAAEGEAARLSVTRFDPRCHAQRMAQILEGARRMKAGSKAR
jgi:glycosyltransferase involved in cell wall biosynthesis